MGAELAFGKMRECSDKWPWWLHSRVLALKATPFYTEKCLEWKVSLYLYCAKYMKEHYGWFPVGVRDAEPYDM